MRHKGLIALLMIFAAGILVTTCTSRVLGERTLGEISAVMEERSAQPGLEAAGAPPGDEQVAAYSMEEGFGEAPQMKAAAQPKMAAAGAGLESGFADGQSETSEESVSFETDSQPLMIMAEDAASVSADSKEESQMRKEKSEMEASENQETVSISPLDPEPSVSGQLTVDAGTEAESLSYYRSRLAELENRIQKNREKQNVSNSSNLAKSLADSELKLWDNELNLIYGEIKDALDDDEAAELIEEERAWIRERDRKAVEAAKASAGGSLESVEYTASLAESTRARAYELLDRYEEWIK